jgi:hypothetical protein
MGSRRNQLAIYSHFILILLAFNLFWIMFGCELLPPLHINYCRIVYIRMYLAVFLSLDTFSLDKYVTINME